MVAKVPTPAPQQFTNEEAIDFLLSECRRIGVNEVARRVGMPSATIKNWVRNRRVPNIIEVIRLINQTGGVFTVTFLPSAVPLARRQVRRGRPPGGPGFWKD